MVPALVKSGGLGINSPRAESFECTPGLAYPHRQGHYSLMGRRLQTYESPGITVTFDPEICIHSGICLRGMPAVFDVSRRDWVRPYAGTVEEVAAQVRRCPSGALQFRLTDAK
jgi:uncharacterized Fe-S cluster protein YjdI